MRIDTWDWFWVNRWWIEINWRSCRYFPFLIMNHVWFLTDKWFCSDYGPFIQDIRTRPKDYFLWVYIRSQQHVFNRVGLVRFFGKKLKNWTKSIEFDWFEFIFHENPNQFDPWTLQSPSCLICHLGLVHAHNIYFRISIYSF